MKNQGKRKKISFLKVVMIFIMFICAYIYLIGNICIQAEDEVINVGESYKKVKVTFLGYDISKLGKETGKVDTNTIGEYEIEYTPIFSSKKYHKKIRVVDMQEPKIVLKGDSEITIENIDDFIEPGFSAIDNYDGDLTKKVKIKKKKYKKNYYEIKYIVEDSSNNKAVAKRRIHIKVGTVYLTFDDGPSVDTTPKILNILEKKHIKATFFVIKYNKEKEDLIKRERKEGHTIALHGLSHNYSSIYTSIDNLMKNFYSIEDLVKKSTGGYTSKIIRFPGGSSNTISKRYSKGIMTQAIKRVTKEGYTYFDWNVDSCDASNAKNAEDVYQNVTSGILPGRNNVVLMHDFSGNTKTVEALERIIDFCIDNNYELKPITSDTVPVRHNVLN